MRMSYCPTCGRERASDARYCRGCGRDFGVEAMAGSTVPAEEPDVEPVHPDPFAEEPPQTVTVTPTGRPAAPEPVWGPAEYLPPSGGPAEAEDVPPGERRGDWRTLWVLAAVIVLLAAGGGTYVLVKHLKGQPTAGQGDSAPTPTVRAIGPATQPASTLAASPEASASPSPSASPSASPSPSVVSIGPAVNNASPQVEVVLSHYFQGINDRNYAEYASSETAQGIADQPKSSFDAGYATTTDTGMTLESLTSTGGGDLTATVVFTSRQSPSDSVDGSACNDWTLNLYLVPSGARYLIAPAPSDYQPTYADC